MASPHDTYLLAQQVIDQHGEDAQAYADATLRHHLESDDLTTAGLWLAIGNAIDDLANLPPSNQRH
jgi:hypothetical protein